MKKQFLIAAFAAFVLGAPAQAAMPLGVPAQAPAASDSEALVIPVSRHTSAWRTCRAEYGNRLVRAVPARRGNVRCIYVGTRAEQRRDATRSCRRDGMRLASITRWATPGNTRIAFRCRR